MRVDPHCLQDGDTYDVVVVGAGGAGLAAALFAALDGARVLVLESTAYVGGTTALSAGTTWIPGTHHSAVVNPADTLADAARYLNNAIAGHSPAELRHTFLGHGAAAVERLDTLTVVRFRAYAKHPDYLSDLPGAALSGRALEPVPFDGRLLGPLLALLRPPIPEFTVLGGMMVDRTDINHLLGLTTSWASLRHATKIILRHAIDRLRGPRGTRLVMGNALVGRLLHALSRFDQVTLQVNTPLGGLVRGAAGVDRVTVSQAGQSKTLHVTGGVVLASGGFNRHAVLRQQLLPLADAAWCPGAPGHTGAAQDMARAIGACFGGCFGDKPLGQVNQTSHASHAFWAPVSIRKRADGTQAVFPHFVMDRAKPGMLTVNQAGQRFVNESTTYQLFALAMQQQQPPAIPAYLICDAAALKKYGIGMVRPGGGGRKAFLADGYLTEAATLGDLAQMLGLDAQALVATVARFNAHAENGTDPDFHRGETAYQHNIGDAAAGGKNPNLGALTQAPFYAVRLYPGDIGASTGLVTDTKARVLDASSEPIAGLYAVGNDMNSIMGGIYTAPGITIGPGLVFASLAAADAVARAKKRAIS
jgi:glycine/D-amino acid oxidase-like deaminating enzyme